MFIEGARPEKTILRSFSRNAFSHRLVDLFRFAPPSISFDRPGKLKPLAAAEVYDFSPMSAMRHARQTGANHDRIIVLQLDNARWHGPENLPVPDGIRPV